MVGDVVRVTMEGDRMAKITDIDGEDGGLDLSYLDGSGNTVVLPTAVKLNTAELLRRCAEVERGGEGMYGGEALGGEHEGMEDEEQVAWLEGADENREEEDADSFSEFEQQLAAVMEIYQTRGKLAAESYPPVYDRGSAGSASAAASLMTDD
jgi:hypothetical protein